MATQERKHISLGSFFSRRTIKKRSLWCDSSVTRYVAMAKRKSEDAKLPIHAVMKTNRWASLPLGNFFFCCPIGASRRIRINTVDTDDCAFERRTFLVLKNPNQFYVGNELFIRGDSHRHNNPDRSSSLCIIYFKLISFTLHHPIPRPKMATSL